MARTRSLLGDAGTPQSKMADPRMKSDRSSHRFRRSPFLKKCRRVSVALLLLSGIALAVQLAMPAIEQTTAAEASNVQTNDPGQLRAVSCSAQADCMAVGGIDTNAPVLTTSNGGKTWVQHPRLPTNLSSVSCNTPNDCLAVGMNGATYNTTNGGQSWSRNYVGVDILTANLYGVACPTASDCIAVGKTYTDDEGFRLPTSTHPNPDTAALVFSTTDAGTSWSSDPIPTGSYWLSGVSCLSSSRCVAVGEAQPTSGSGPGLGIVYVTTDGGTSWSSRSVSGNVGPLSSISCTTTKFCLAGQQSPGETDVFVETTDGGQTWETQITSTNKGGIASVSCDSASACVAVGSTATGPTILTTSDGGAQWTGRPTPLGIETLASVSCKTGTTCVAVGGTLQRNTIAASADAGSSWANDSLASPITWLAAGDSYASGAGLPRTTGCGQGTGRNGLSSTWSVVAAAQLKTEGYSFAGGSPVLVACTGAISDQFFNTDGQPTSRQWSPWMGRFDLVTFSFGGDDLGFATIISDCVELGCPSDSSVRQKIHLLGTTGVYKGSLHIPAYPTFLKHVANTAVVSGGNVVVMGYPELVEDPTLWTSGRQNCYGITAGEARTIRGWAGDLNATIGQSVGEVNALPMTERNGVHFTFIDPVTGQADTGITKQNVNLFEPSVGSRHELCSDGQWWLNGITLLHLKTRSFHPNQTGEDAMGALAAEVIPRLTWPWPQPLTDSASVAARTQNRRVDVPLITSSGEITGRVTDATGGADLSGICITLETTTDAYAGSVITTADGIYSLTGLTPGSYKVYFSTGCGSAGNYAAQYYGDKATFTSATSVSVTGGRVATSINAVLSAGGRITGTVNTASSEADLSGICVSAKSATGTQFGSATTGLDGTYTIGGLGAGSYKVYFSAGCGSTGSYAAQYYGDKATFTSATSVSVTTGVTTTGINAMVAFGGQITGTVTSASGGADLLGVCVRATSLTGPYSGDTTTAANGTYTITDLAGGSYSVEFSTGCGSTEGYAAQYYNGIATSSSATAVEVAAGVTTTGIDAELTGGASISGKVTASAGGTAVSGVCVTAMTSTGSSAGGAVTSANGTYTIIGLEAGSYKVKFDLCGSVSHVIQFYNGGTTFTSATLVSVSGIETDTGVNASLATPPGEIAGVVTALQGGAGLPGVCVTAWTGTGGYVGAVTTAADGDYTMGGLAAGSYKVEFNGCGAANKYLAQFYDGATTWTSSTAVSVIGANSTTAINAALSLVTLAANPAKPSIPTAIPGDGKVKISWTAPTTAGSPITGYTVTSTPSAKTCTTTGALSCTVTGLQNGTAYIFTVKARNTNGTSTPSTPSAKVTPSTLPGKAAKPTVVPGNMKAKVTWTAPTTGGSPITRYAVTSTPSAKTCTTTGALTCTVTGLQNGTAYTFTVKAHNADGTGPASTPSAAVVPSAPAPPAPTSGYDLVGRRRGVRLLPARDPGGFYGSLPGLDRRSTSTTSWAWCRPPTTRATSWSDRTAGSSPSATPRSWGRCPGSG